MMKMFKNIDGILNKMTMYRAVLYCLLLLLAAAFGLSFFIFDTTSNPPIITNGIIYKLAIHQLADCLEAKVISTKDMAAGLKRCFLPGLIMRQATLSPSISQRLF